MQPRTRRQKEVLDYITRFIENHGFEPSYQQIAMSLGVASKGGIAKHIGQLEKQNFITRRRENGIFKLELRSASSIADFVCEIEWLDVPKNKTLAEDWENELLFVPKFLLNNQTPKSLRAFRVPNDAMLEEHICEGDIALIQEKSFARDGEIVVALTQNKRAVLKKFFRNGASVELRPANPQYDSIVLPADKVSVQGILRGILRPFF
ncbi:MAG: transcriptional repressor LexA [Acidobacteriota bacterium]|jgi:repressor LexA|nr:transcriptional repressor LexA [Acidobacteriota bacterium]